MPSKKGPTDYRSAKSGEFVTKRYAAKHPSTTVKESNHPRKQSSKTKRK